MNIIASRGWGRGESTRDQASGAVCEVWTVFKPRKVMANSIRDSIHFGWARGQLCEELEWCFEIHKSDNNGWNLGQFGCVSHHAEGGVEDAGYYHLGYLNDLEAPDAVGVRCHHGMTKAGGTGIIGPARQPAACMTTLLSSMVVVPTTAYAPSVEMMEIAKAVSSGASQPDEMMAMRCQGGWWRDALLPEEEAPFPLEGEVDHHDHRSLSPGMRRSSFIAEAEGVTGLKGVDEHHAAKLPAFQPHHACNGARRRLCVLLPAGRCRAGPFPQGHASALNYKDPNLRSGAGQTSGLWRESIEKEEGTSTGPDLRSGPDRTPITKDLRPEVRVFIVQGTVAWAKTKGEPLVLGQKPKGQRRREAGWISTSFATLSNIHSSSGATKRRNGWYAELRHTYQGGALRGHNALEWGKAKAKAYPLYFKLASNQVIESHPHTRVRAPMIALPASPAVYPQGSPPQS
uniref:SH3 domain-containing protein n=1 Tax=Panagrellus redivivus TaxID=6233 RepID=A0A7E4VV13_PANRE